MDQSSPARPHPFGCAKPQSTLQAIRSERKTSSNVKKFGESVVHPFCTLKNFKFPQNRSDCARFHHESRVCGVKVCTGCILILDGFGCP